MRRRQALFAAVLVLATGLGGALLFRQSPPAASEQRRSADSVQHRAQDGPRVLMEVRTAPPATNPAPMPAQTQHSQPEPPTGISGLPLFEDGNASVPRIAQRYPTPVASPPTPPAEIRHHVVDGDTLAALAERYLGDARRASAIYAANRDVLDDPELLPIGALLKIPERQ